MKEILSQVLSSVKPSRKEMSQELELAKGLAERIRKGAPRSCDVVLTGSIAKKTFLRDGRDIDIFVLFERSVPRESLEASVKEIMGSVFPSVGYQVSYAEHPYVRFHFQGRKIDLVPAYRISDSSERMSAVDRSVLHTRYVRNALKVRQADEVLLLKQFLKANSLYGAEIKVEGFSGYLCELLIIRFGTFTKLIKAASGWDEAFIDLKRHYGPKEKAEALERFGPFTVIDPTDKERNVAAAVSPKNFKRFAWLCRKFLKKPSEEFFLFRPETFEQKVRKASKGGKLYVLSMPRPDVVDDVLWGQLHKMAKQLKDHLADFRPKEIIPDDGRHMVRLGIVLREDRLSPKMLIQGPPLSMKGHVAKFKRSHKGARFIKKGKKLHAEVRRPVTRAETAIKRFLKAFGPTRSHLAYPEEMYVLERA